VVVADPRTGEAPEVLYHWGATESSDLLWLTTCIQKLQKVRSILLHPCCVSHPHIKGIQQQRSLAAKLEEVLTKLRFAPEVLGSEACSIWSVRLLVQVRDQMRHFINYK